MRSNNENNTLTIYFEGELNSYNADNIEKEIEAIVGKESFKTLNLDLGALRYVSSAGLRVFLKLKQRFGDVHIIEASLEVYDILSMTGFTNIMDVKKALKRVYISGAEVIGEGFFSTVYRIDKDTIIKVFNRTSDPNQIQRELDLSKQAFVLGIPTAISYDIVRVEDKLGVRFEMLDCISLKNAYLSDKYNYEDLTKRYVGLLNKINSTDCMNPNLPDIKKFYLEKVEVDKEFLEEKYYLKAKKIIESIPDSQNFIHGDCHFKNIMVQGDDLLLIDMDTLSHGDKIFELAALRNAYISFEEDDPGNCEKFLGCPKEMCSRLFNDLVKGSVGNNDKETMDKIAMVSYIHMIWWNKMNTPDFKPRLEGNRSRLIKLLDEYDDAKI